MTDNIEEEGVFTIIYSFQDRDPSTLSAEEKIAPRLSESDGI